MFVCDWIGESVTSARGNRTVQYVSGMLTGNRRTVAAIQRNVVKQGKRNAIPRILAKHDKDTINNITLIVSCVYDHVIGPHSYINIGFLWDNYLSLSQKGSGKHPMLSPFFITTASRTSLVIIAGSFVATGSLL